MDGTVKHTGTWVSRAWQLRGHSHVMVNASCWKANLMRAQQSQKSREESSRGHEVGGGTYRRRARQMAKERSSMEAAEPHDDSLKASMLL